MLPKNSQCKNGSHNCYLSVQHYWICKTCCPNGEKRTLPNHLFGIPGYQRPVGICDECAKRCHKGHELIDAGVDPHFYCDCSLSCGKTSCCCCNSLQKCTRLIPTSGLEVNWGQITRLQHTWQCKTCGIIGNNYICNACKERCHIGHDVIDTGIREAVCCCNEKTSKCKAKEEITGEAAMKIRENGIPCETKKEERNEKNKRHHHHYRHHKRHHHHYDYSDSSSDEYSDYSENEYDYDYSDSEYDYDYSESDYGYPTITIIPVVIQMPQFNGNSFIGF